MSLGDRIVVMHDGIIRQVGAPLSVYDSPKDRFVAGFVGMPPMNFFNGRVCSENEQVYFDLAGSRVDLPRWMWDKLGSYMNKDMVLGARPEHLAPGSTGPEGVAASVEMEVTVAEPLGSNQDIYLVRGEDERVIARCDAHVRVESGSRIPVAFELDKLHVFEPGELGKNVTINREGNSTGVSE